ncbi:Fe-S cluster biogenesis protein NfuA [Bradyrhizobium sp. JR1.5]|uniref:NifU family protein n=1 Tax=unclassified Bradyrhizobium TaxID=2631580 RepID=UPI00339B8995
MGIKTAPTKQPPSFEPSDREKIVRAVLDENRASLRRDRGDCELIVRLTGTCMSCKHACTTLAAIQAGLIERLGEFVRLIPLPGAAKVRH